MYPQSVSVWLPVWERSFYRWNKRKRLALPNAEIMIHQPSGGAQGQATEIQIAAEHILKTKKKLNRFWQKYRTAIREYRQDTERDNFMTAEEAKEYGLIDEVIGKAIDTI